MSVGRLELERPGLVALRALASRAPRRAGSRRRRRRAAPGRTRPADAASSIASAVGVGDVSTPAGGATERFAASRTTSAPRRRASSASATPIRPDERLPTKRTASTASRVPPAVTSTRLPGERRRREQLRRPARRSRPARPSARRPTRPRPSRPRRARSAPPRARAASRRSRASPGAPTCAGSSPARRAPARGARAPPRSAGCRPARERASRACWPCTARRRAGRRASDARRDRRPAGRRASARNVSARTNRSAPGVTSGTTSWPALHEQPRQLAGLVRRDPAADPEQDPSHARIVPSACDCTANRRDGVSRRARTRRTRRFGGRCWRRD